MERMILVVSKVYLEEKQNDLIYFMRSILKLQNYHNRKKINNLQKSTKIVQLLTYNNKTPGIERMLKTEFSQFLLSLLPLPKL